MRAKDEKETERVWSTRVSDNLITQNEMATGEWKHPGNHGCTCAKELACTRYFGNEQN